MTTVIKRILATRSTAVVARIVLTFLFWSAGIFGLFNFAALTNEMTSVSLPFPEFFAIATISVQLAGSFLLVTNFKKLGWLGAGALGVFTLLTIPLGHAFWTFAEPQRTHEFHIVVEHITVVGGLLLAAIMTKE